MSNLASVNATDVWGPPANIPRTASAVNAGNARMGVHDVMSLDHALMLFRRFDHLHLQALLHTQSKLIAFEQRLNELPDEDPGKAELLDTICADLNRYNQLLLRHAKLHHLPQPRKTFIRSLRDWINDHDVLNHAKFLDNTSDLVALVPTQNSGVMFRFLENLLHKFISWRKFNSETPYVYDDSSIHAVVRFLLTLGGTMFLLAPIITLSFIHDKKIALVIIICFTLGFSAMLGMLTEGKNHELMAATAAYAAVMVVFVGTN